jgi:hypothetical protein
MQSTDTIETTTGLKPHELLVLAVLSVAALVLASMDQCTRGPSLTGMALSNAHLFF